MKRLSNATLAAVAAGVGIPSYDRAATKAGVVHLGPGAFHRAHQAAAFDTLLAHDPRWGITGVSLHSTSVADALNPQDGLYTLALLDEAISYRVIGSIKRVQTAHDGTAVLATLADADTRIISLTVTEKGYCLSGDGTLDMDHAGIVRDLSGDMPTTAIGWIVAGLAKRKHLRLPGVTVLSCDNLASNGRKLGAAVRTFAEARDADLARWIEDNVRFPNAMVDSITPATDDVLRARVASAIGVEDSWPIQREGFTQWVIEDDFAGERPELDRAGVTFTNDVHGYEAAKLRLLNGPHSTLAYVGLGLGHASVAAAMADPKLAAFIERLMREDIAPPLTPPAGFDIDAYITAILKRFANPAIEHKLSQIAWDGSQKLPYRILDTIRDALTAGRPIDRLAVPIAAWLRFIARAAATGERITDPMADRLLAAGGDWRAILAMQEIFGSLSSDPRFLVPVERAHTALADPDGY